MVKCLQKEISRRVRVSLYRRLASDTRGQQLVEFAFVVWILLALLILVFWAGRAYSVYQAVERAAREGARVYLASPCATCGSDTGDSVAATTAINNALSAATLTPALQTPPSPVITNAVAVVPADSPYYGQVSGVTVTVTYPLQLNLPFLGYLTATPGGIPSVPISATVTLRQEY
jgi:Flp pilus assembly protein TadG